MASEGSREIEAARKRLAAAKSQVSASSENVQSVKEMITKMMEGAQSQLARAKKEAKEAETMLKDAEKRWEVINIDMDSDDDKTNDGGSKKKRKGSSNKDGGCKKRRKVSQKGNNNITIVQPDSSNRGNNTTTDGQTISNGSSSALGTQSNNSGSGRGVGRSETVITTASIVPRKISVEGCGSSEVNGIYTLSKTLHRDSLLYHKMGKWEGNQVKFVIYRHKATNFWRIARWDASVNKSTFHGMYVCLHNANPLTPPEKGWTPLEPSLHPAPTCTPVGLSNLCIGYIVVAGCGVSELNAIYTRTDESCYGSPVYTCVYTKGVSIGEKQQGLGESVTFQIYRRTVQQQDYWYIGISGSNSFYRAPVGDNPKIPPKDGWGKIGSGVHPAPNLTHVSLGSKGE